MAELDQLAQGVRTRDRVALGRALTLVESEAAAHRDQAQALLAELLPDTGKALRVGITGLPGSGKSTLIDALGMHAISKGHRVAVLAIDPSSQTSGGSILGDKTRMARLSNAAEAFIRPSPSAGSLGGVARKTREAMLICEAAGFDVIFVETVGVGQSEAAVADLVDFVGLVLIGDAGDELQGIKRGLMEVADCVVVNKADGDRRRAAELTCGEYARALQLMPPRPTGWRGRAVLCSATEENGIPELWQVIGEHRSEIESTGALGEQRAEQRRRWMWAIIEHELLRRFRDSPAVQARLAQIEGDVLAGKAPPTQAADSLLSLT